MVTECAKKFVKKWSLQCCFTNARGLLGILDELKVTAMEKSLDIIGVAETWLTGEVDNAEIAIDGFRIVRKDRSEVKKGKHGGVLMYIRENITTRQCPDLNGSLSESVWCRVIHNRNNIDGVTVGVCYKSPAAEEQEIDELLLVMGKASKGEVLIMGDFNFPGVNWHTYESDGHGERFRDFVLDNFLIQHVKEPTREYNILDLVLTTNEHMVEHLEVHEHLGNSDHNTIYWNLICDIKQSESSHQHRQYSRGNYECMREDLMKINWEEEFKDLEIDELWKRFKDILELEVDKCVPLTAVRRRKYPKWMSREARRARNYKVKKMERL